ncbi:MAG: adaptor protein MecA [Clostridia bacterium]|nr:adaptor protein MecA [Clostridia bacterium]
MELTPIGKEKLEIALTPKDMERFHLTAELLDYKNTETRRAVWTILDTAKRKTGFDAADGKIRIDALPGKEGGCVIFITKTPNGVDKKENMNSAKEKYPALVGKPRKIIYGFANLTDLLHVCLFLRARGYRGESNAFMEAEGSRAKNKYYLSLTESAPYREKSPYAVFESMFIAEFGKKLSDEHTFAYINEHCECFCESGAVEVLAEIA